MLRLLAAHLEVAELGVRQQPAVDEDRGADAGAQRQHHHRAVAAATGAERHLGDARRVGVVQERDRSTEAGREQPLRVGADPARDPRWPPSTPGPAWSTAGNASPTGPTDGSSRAIEASSSITSGGAASAGVGRRSTPPTTRARGGVHEPRLHEGAADVVGEDRRLLHGSGLLQALDHLLVGRERHLRVAVPGLLLPAHHDARDHHADRDDAR